jgi:hypothetical protein
MLLMLLLLLRWLWLALMLVILLDLLTSQLLSPLYRLDLPHLPTPFRFRLVLSRRWRHPLLHSLRTLESLLIALLILRCREVGAKLMCSELIHWGLGFRTRIHDFLVDGNVWLTYLQSRSYWLGYTLQLSELLVHQPVESQANRLSQSNIVLDGVVLIRSARETALKCVDIGASEVFGKWYTCCPFLGGVVRESAWIEVDTTVNAREDVGEHPLTHPLLWGYSIEEWIESDWVSNWIVTSYCVHGSLGRALYPSPSWIGLWAI